MTDYLYDETFEGLLTCIYHHYYHEKADGIFAQDAYQGDLLTACKRVDTDQEKAATVYDAIARKISLQALRRIYKAHCSTVKNKEMAILQYVCLGFREGHRIGMHHGHPVVAAVQDAEQKVNNEVHRLLGLLRFSQLENQAMYASVAPDHRILEFLADHFCDRFRNQPFLIHDTKRGQALVAYQGQWYITDFSKEQLPDFAQDEKSYRRLWKEYFESIAIAQRTNSRCQKNFMPVRYWANLTEFQ